MPYTRRGVRHKQVCKRVEDGQKKLFVTLPRQGIEPRVFGFEFRLSNHWARSLVAHGLWNSANVNTALEMRITAEDDTESCGQITLKIMQFLSNQVQTLCACYIYNRVTGWLNWLSVGPRFESQVWVFSKSKCCAASLSVCPTPVWKRMHKNDYVHKLKIL